MSLLDHSPSFIFIAIWQSVGVRVVKERVVPVTPGVRLVSESHIAVPYKGLSPVLCNVMVVSLLFLPGAVGAHEAAGNGDEQRDETPCAHGFHSMHFFLDGLLLKCADHTPPDPGAREASQPKSQSSRHVFLFQIPKFKGQCLNITFHTTFGLLELSNYDSSVGMPIPKKIIMGVKNKVID